MPSVKDLMTKNVVSINIQKTIYDAAVLMSTEEKGCLVVEEGNMPVGIVTERDFVRRAVSKKLPLDTEISAIMSKPLITINPDSSIRDAARLMVENKIRRLPVVQENKLVGIIVASDFARHLSKRTLTEEVINAIGRYPYPIYPG